MSTTEDAEVKNGVGEGATGIRMSGDVVMGNARAGDLGPPAKEFPSPLLP